MASGNYCSNCGQSTDIHVPRLSEFLHEFISHHIAFEGALVASVKRLLISPGGLTLDYYAGRRARYVAPLRLYLTFNVIFFLAVQIFQLFGGAEDDSAKSALASLNSSDARQVAAEVEKDLDDDASLTPEQKRLAIEKLKLMQKQVVNFSVAAPSGANTNADSSAAPAGSAASAAPSLPKPAISFSFSGDAAKPDVPGAPGVGVGVAPPAASSVPAKADSENADTDDDEHDDREDTRREILNAIHSDLKTPQLNQSPAVRVTSQPRKWQQFENSIIPAWVDLHMPLVRRRLDQVPNRKPGEFVHNAIHYAPYTLLMLLPICAMLLQISFIGCGRRYVEHLVAALHGHTFLFIVLLLFLPLSGVLNLILVLAAMLHMMFALSRIYRSRGIGLMFRLGILSVSYTIAFVFATAGEFVLSILA
jgi:hypothetical protein